MPQPCTGSGVRFYQSVVDGCANINVPITNKSGEDDVTRLFSCTSTNVEAYFYIQIVK